MLLKDFVNPLYILAINKIASFLNVLGVFFFSCKNSVYDLISDPPRKPSSPNRKLPLQALGHSCFFSEGHWPKQSDEKPTKYGSLL